MSRAATGEVRRCKDGSFSARISTGGKYRKTYQLPKDESESSARARALVLATAAKVLLCSGKLDSTEGSDLLQLASRCESSMYPGIISVADLIASEKVTRSVGSVDNKTGAPVDLEERVFELQCAVDSLIDMQVKK